MGQDTLAGFLQWRNPERIRELATLAVVERSGDPWLWNESVLEGVVSVSARRVDVSSTEIRERRRARKSIKGFVPDSVERFIEARGLYR
jgi:nicotinate-nucleotide adenylyltransferase